MVRVVEVSKTSDRLVIVENARRQKRIAVWWRKGGLSSPNIFFFLPAVLSLLLTMDPAICGWFMCMWLDSTPRGLPSSKSHDRACLPCMACLWIRSSGCFGLHGSRPTCFLSADRTQTAHKCLDHCLQQALGGSGAWWCMVTNPSWMVDNSREPLFNHGNGRGVATNCRA